MYIPQTKYKSLCLTLLITLLTAIISKPLYCKAISYPWTVSASLGYAQYQQVHHGDQLTALGRFALGKDIVQLGSALFGLELGIQSGNQMRLRMTDQQTEALGGLLIQTTLKPMLDGLLTMRIIPGFSNPIFLQFKTGVALRRWQMDRDTVNDISQSAWEFIAGGGYAISPNASMTLSYQGIFGAKPNFTVDLTNGSGHVQNIPVQHAVILGIIWMI